MTATTPSTSAPSFLIGDVVIDPPVVLAPMADVTNGPFRRICKRIGRPGLVCTEQISTQAIHYRNDRTLRMFDWTDDEQPVSVQLFGGDPAIMAEAACVVADRGARIVDINMGCWVPKVCRTGSGAALLRDPDTAMRVVEAVVRAVDIPVTVKMRVGWTASDLIAPTFARRFEQIGVRALTLHGRTAIQGFEGTADWRWIAEVKSAVTVPVIGNGDVRVPDDAVRMMRETGCDGIMIGRGAIGNPWVLRDAAAVLQGTTPGPCAPLSVRVAVAMEHLCGLAAIYGEDRAVRHLRGQLPQYVKGFPGASHAREQIMYATTIAQVREILSRVGHSPQDVPLLTCS